MTPPPTKRPQHHHHPRLPHNLIPNLAPPLHLLRDPGQILPIHMRPLSDPIPQPIMLIPRPPLLTTHIRPRIIPVPHRVFDMRRHKIPIPKPRFRVLEILEILRSLIIEIMNRLQERQTAALAAMPIGLDLILPFREPVSQGPVRVQRPDPAIGYAAACLRGDMLPETMVVDHEPLFMAREADAVFRRYRHAGDGAASLAEHRRGQGDKIREAEGAGRFDGADISDHFLGRAGRIEGVEGEVDFFEGADTVVWEAEPLDAGEDAEAEHVC